eukprot:TRINITY_DN10113_c0_g1_i4.p2 TRINITY_DN10113_c0_g1~~TRINITY_DN10113_c0_g1_i4.p2  ORF type:complete len:198 (+),score=-13.50 TRINITY_DN10113_c0_g1_i4:241-834(+)
MFEFCRVFSCYNEANLQKYSLIFQQKLLPGITNQLRTRKNILKKQQGVLQIFALLLIISIPKQTFFFKNKKIASIHESPFQFQFQRFLYKCILCNQIISFLILHFGVIQFHVECIKSVRSTLKLFLFNFDQINNVVMLTKTISCQKLLHVLILLCLILIFILNFYCKYYIFSIQTNIFLTNIVILYYLQVEKYQTFG